MIAKNTYDELGQLISKNVGGTDATGASGLQTVDYNYNIRGWLKNINDVNNIGTDLFSFKINYNDAETATDLYNGNISETFWKTNSDNKLRKYQFSYDNLNRLLDASYSRVNQTTAPNAYRESLSYDKNGNIKELSRYGLIDDAIYAIHIDDLRYTYDSQNKNQLLAVEDKSQSPKGFKDGVNEGNDYEYDANGNMKVDKNKEIETIIYNHLNLPTEINFASTDKISYIYNTTGQKVTKAVIQGNNTIQTDYLAGGFQYKNNVLLFFPHAEGYVNVIDDKYNYVFNYTDHLGNIRLSYGVDPSTQTLKILEENHYYPFGLKHEGYNMDYKMYQKIQSGAIAIRLAAPLQPNYTYKYNGFELQSELELNWYDYKARNYDPALGRWVNVDPLAEMSRRFSPYTYALNNPVFFIDPDGMLATAFDDPGDEFKTKEAAVKDFANQYNGISIRNDTELGSYIYKGTSENGDTYYSYTVPENSLYTKKGDGTGEVLGKDRTVKIDKVPEGTEVVSDIHTHGADDRGVDPNSENVNDFSDQDKYNNIENAKNTKGYTAYISTGEGTVLEHNPYVKGDPKPSGSSISVISNDAPSDPKSPTRKNNISPKVTPNVMPNIYLDGIKNDNLLKK